MSEVIVALDVPELDDALSLVRSLGDDATFYKVGLELYTAAGPDSVHALRNEGKRVFLDLKLHDIPNTVARATERAGALGVELLTVHVTGGARMLSAAREAAPDGLRLLGVTLLTSMAVADVEEVWGRELRSVRDEVARLTQVALEHGLQGVVASATEAAWIRARVPDTFLVVTPGIRPSHAGADDQRRPATPADAVRAGADYLVVGRPITRASDPRGALRAILAEMEGAGGPDSTESNEHFTP